MSLPVSEAITKLWVPTEGAFELENQPWNSRVGSLIPQEEDQATAFLKKLKDPTVAWGEIFVKASPEGYITKPQLGKPGPQFYYNVNATETQEKNVNMLPKAEANLDAFWKHVEGNLNVLASNWQQGALKRLFDEAESMHRTIPWSERDHFGKAKSPPIQDIYDSKPQPLFGVFHDSSVEITGSFKKTSIIEKTKDKTRGIPDHAEAEVGPACEPSPAPRLEFTLSKKYYSIFRALSHLPARRTRLQSCGGSRSLAPLSVSVSLLSVCKARNGNSIRRRR
jgi:hypothetical protein